MSVDDLHPDNLSKSRWSCPKGEGEKVSLCFFTDLDALLEEKEPSAKKRSSYCRKERNQRIGLTDNWRILFSSSPCLATLVSETAIQCESVFLKACDLFRRKVPFPKDSEHI